MFCISIEIVAMITLVIETCCCQLNIKKNIICKHHPLKAELCIINDLYEYEIICKECFHNAQKKWHIKYLFYVFAHKSVMIREEERKKKDSHKKYIPNIVT